MSVREGGRGPHLIGRHPAPQGFRQSELPKAYDGEERDAYLAEQAAAAAAAPMRARCSLCDWTSWGTAAEVLPRQRQHFLGAHCQDETHALKANGPRKGRQGPRSPNPYWSKKPLPVQERLARDREAAATGA